MTKLGKYVIIGAVGIALGLPTMGCQKSAEQDNASKASFYGTPPPASAQAQIKAQQDAQAKAMANAGKR
jgi:hypothetical protein